MMRSEVSLRHMKHLASSVAIIAAIGCGGDGLDRHEVQGTVTFAGDVVNAGQLMFVPDPALGTIAPSGYAKVENGAFKIEQEEGPITGTYTFRVSGYDLSRADEDQGEGFDVRMLFPEYVTTVEIPTPDGRLDIEVPSKPGGSK